MAQTNIDIKFIFTEFSNQMEILTITIVHKIIIFKYKPSLN